MIIVIIFSLLGDGNTLYLMDKSFSLLPPEEEFQFIYSKKGFQTTQGCLDLERWNQTYRTKIWMPLFSKLVMEYKLYKEEDYNVDEEEHLFNFRWIPNEKDKLPLSFSLFISPTYLKNKDYLGVGVGYWKNIKNNHFLNIIIHEFDHNYIISKTEGLIYEDPFTQFPITIELKGNISSTQADLFYSYSKKIPGKKNFLEYSEKVAEGEYGGMGLNCIIYYHFFTKISGGIRLKYIQADSSFSHLNEDSLNYETKTEKLFSEPYIEIKLSPRNYFYVGFPIDWKYTKNDSLNYRRKWIGLTLLYKRRVWNAVNLGLGFQKSWRNLNGNKRSETRGILALEAKLKEKVYFSILEGIEMDTPLPSKLYRYHNHTFITLNYCF
jgi:hypothetical protein